MCSTETPLPHLGHDGFLKLTPQNGHTLKLGETPTPHWPQNNSMVGFGAVGFRAERNTRTQNRRGMNAPTGMTV